MKIAVPTTFDGLVDSHFGHCEFFTVFNIDDNSRKITNSEAVESPSECGCRSGIASTLSSMGVEVMLAGNMGQGAVNVLSSHNIAVVRGCQGNAEEVVLDFLNGQAVDSGESCSQHAGHSGGQCGHS